MSVVIEETEETEIGNLFGDDEKEVKKGNLDISKSIRVQASEVKVIGYFLLSKPAFDKAINPLTVGCIFQTQTSSNNKYYMRVRKIDFALHYLLNFISLDPVSG
jgi:hypothetical protein